MDSVTQFVLGAGVASLGLGPKLGWRAVLTGGLIATLPDLDSLVPYESRLDAVTHHRGFSHSLFVQTLVSPALAYGVYRFFKKDQLGWWQVWLTVWLCLITHSLLDSLTTYGTQLFWPFNFGPPVAVPSIFIIDPIYTLLLLVGVIGFGIYAKRRPSRARRFSQVFMILGTLYLGAGLSAHMIVKARAMALPQLQNMLVHVQPTPFNILYWQVLAVDDAKMLLGTTSVFRNCQLIDFKTLDRSSKVSSLPSPLPEDVKRFEWFTGGFYTYREGVTGVSISDLRMGLAPNFLFSYRFASPKDGVTVLHRPQRIPQPPRRFADLKKLYKLASIAPSGCW